MLRVRSLLRLSSKAQVKRKGDDATIPDQREIISRFLKEKPEWFLDSEYIEAGVSAYKTNLEDRDVMQDALRDAREKQYDVLIVWKGDRLARRVRDMPGLVEDLNSAGVQVWSVVDGTGGKQWTARTAMEMLILALEGFKGQSESENISIRTKEKKRQMLEEGKWRGSPVPYGYQLVSVKDESGEPVIVAGRPVRELVPHPEHAAVVREMYRRYLSGEGYVYITRWLNQSDIPSSRGKRWFASQVRLMMVNPFYAGYVGKQFRRGRHESLISEEEWRRFRLVSEMKANIPIRQRGGNFPLTGVLFCGVCGVRMGSHARPPKKGGRGYRCSSWRKGDRCDMPVQKAERVEEAFVQAVINETNWENVRARLEETSANGKRILEDWHAMQAQARKRISQIDAALAELTKEFLEHHTYSRDEYASIKATYAAEKDGLEEQLKQPQPRVDEIDVDALLLLVKDFRSNWDAATPEERKQLALYFCHRIKRRAYLDRDGSIAFR